MRILVLGLFASCLAQAALANDLNVGFGASVPKESGASVIEKSGPSRVSGGEQFTISFRGYKTITSVRLTDFSASHQGKLLIRSALAFYVDGNGNVNQVRLEGLTQFSKVTAGNPENYQNLVMLADGHYVEVAPGATYYEIQLTIEGFSNSDAGMLLQIGTAEGVQPADFVIKRTGSTEIAGGYIDENNYANFSIGELANLMKTGTHPALDDLAGHSFVCSGFNKPSAPQIDFKTRTWYNNNGALQSSTNLDGTLATWSPTQEGWSMPISNKNGCGQYTTNNIIRKTAGGNLVSEVEINRYNYLVQCANAGYDWNAQAAELDSETYPAVVNPAYRALSYEFCRPAVLPNP